MRIRFILVSILANVILVILGLVVSLILTYENELNNFDLFIESINNNPIRVYAVSLPTTAEPVFIQNALDTKEKEKFVQFLSSSKETSLPSAGSVHTEYDFQIHEEVGESKVRIWNIEARINKETRICHFWVSRGIIDFLHYGILDERLSEEFRNYVNSLELGN